MANLSYAEKRNLEEFLQMASGYVLGFSNRTFRELIFDSTGLDIDDEAIGGFGLAQARRNGTEDFLPIACLDKRFVDHA